MRRRLALLLATLTAASLLAGCSSTPGASGAVPDKGYIEGAGDVTIIPPAKRGQPISFTGTTLEGAPFDVASWRGQVVVVNVWASWCPPCIKEAPDLEAVYKQVSDKGVRFIGVDTRDQQAAALAHQRKYGVTYPSIDDDGGRVLLAFRGTLPPVATPSTLVLDRQGRVAARVLGRVNATTLLGIVDDVLAAKS